MNHKIWSINKAKSFVRIDFTNNNVIDIIFIDKFIIKYQTRDYYI